MRNVVWIAVGVLVGLGAFALIQAAMTLPSSQFDIILGSALVAVVAALVAVVLAVMIREALEDRRHKAAMDAAETDLDEAEAHLAPLLTGGRGAERAMLRFHREHGLLLLRRASERTRRIAIALDARRPRRRFVPRRAVWDNPAPVMEAPPLAPLPEPPAADLPEMHAAPVVDVDEETIVRLEAWLASPLPGDIVPAPRLPAEGYTDDSTLWRDLKAIGPEVTQP